MLKHPEITRRRIEQFLESELRPRIFGERAPLTVEINDNPCRTQREAEAGPWKPVEPGHPYGPAYRVFWFRIRGAVPRELDGKQVGIVADVGGERTVWKDDSPWCGLDREHQYFGPSSGGAIHGDELARGGAPIEYIIQTHARNAQTTVHGCEKPRDPLTETVGKSELVALDPEIKALAYDVDFALGLMKAIDETDPAYTTILRALNECANVFNPHSRDTIARCGKLIRDALGGLRGELHHTIVPVGHAHLDTAWLWPIEITKLKMAHTTATQLALLERYPEYVFVHSQASQYEWLEQEYPVLFDRVKASAARGQWEPVGSMWVEADCNLTGGESLVRQFLYGRRYFKEKLGYLPDDMWLPDVFGYSAALPQILTKFGIEYFLTQKMSWNQFNKFPHHTFWWQGIDGSRVWTHFPPADTYCGSCEPSEILGSVKNYKDHARSDQSLYAFGFGDGGGGPTERHIELLRRGRLAPNYPQISSGKRAAEFFREAKARSKDLAVWAGELYFELHRGTYTSQAANKRANRECEFLLRDAELLACCRDDFPHGYPKAELEEAWKLVLLNQFHDIIPGSSVQEVYVDSARDYEQVREVGERIVTDSLRRIASKLDSSNMTRPVALFQNASIPGEASIPWSEESAPQSVLTVAGSAPTQVVEAFGERRLIFSAPSECLGTVYVADLSSAPPTIRTRLKARERRLENSDFVVRFDAHGNITNITSQDDEATEFVAAGKLANLFQLFDDKPLFWSAWDVEAYALETGVDLTRSESFEIVERGPVRVAAELVKRFGSSTVRQRISLGPTPGIRFDTEIDWQESEKLLKVAFPLNVNASRATFEIQFGHVERPTHRNTSWDVARFEVCAQKWADLSEGAHGAALLNDGKYGYDVLGNTLRLSLLRAPKAPDPTCDMGVHRFTYVLYPHFDHLQNSDVVAAAYCLNAPVRAALIPAGEGESAELPKLFSCSSRHIVIEAVKQAEDSDRVIVRLYECHNTRGRSELSCVAPIKRAFLADLNEQIIAQLPVEDGVASFDFKPFEIITLKIEL